MTSNCNHKMNASPAPVKMGNRASIYWSQLKAMIVRNILLKKREKRKTVAEVFLPLYFLGILILIKLVMPNPNFPIMNTERGETSLFDHFQQLKNHTVAVVPNTTETLEFLDRVNELWLTKTLGPGLHPIEFVPYYETRDLVAAYWKDPMSIPIAVIFEGDPLNGPLSYEIRTNPNFVATPSTLDLYASHAVCRLSESYWSNVFPIETGESCPVNQYYYSGFVALQALLDYTKIRIESGRTDIEVPYMLLELMPKDAYTGDWMVAFRVIIPLYMVMALSQFITYLLILIVGEKESKIKEGMKIMGLRDSIFWLSWFIIYALFVLVLSVISTVLLFTLQVFQHTHFVPVFLIILLYGLSVIMFAFMLTPFFDKSRTAGILGNFAVNIMSVLYFIQVFVDDSSSVAFWLVSLISSTGFALAMDKALVLDLSGEGVSFENLWSGPGIPFGGSLIMMSLDIVLYGFLAYYLDSVVPSEHGTKRSPLFCFQPSFWCPKKATNNSKEAMVGSQTGSMNGVDFGSCNLVDDATADVEPVPREMKGREAIRIVDLYKSFHACNKPEIKAVNGINLTIYEGQITAILGHNGAGKTTLFNILTGLTSPSAGTALVFGLDIRNPSDMESIRRMTGVCPQHDILFDNLTPREHLVFFAAVRGIPTSEVEYEVIKTLRDIDLLDKADTRAKNLSGGQKRKLSVGIAVIGDPKIIILDEPTAGVDPYSRRHMWSFLQNRRHGKVILLTTHFMDEADILADRKAVVSRGRLRCCGSSLFLKNKFGIGYHLTMVLEGSGKERYIAQMVKSHVNKAERARRHGRELSFILPHNSVDSFSALFSAIEEEIKTGAGNMGISSYGVSMTTLEEVFLHLERDENEGDDNGVDNLSKKMVRSRALSRSLSLQSKTSYQSLQNEGTEVDNNAERVSEPLGETIELPETAEHIGLVFSSVRTHPRIGQTMGALIWLRVLRLFRDIQKLYFMIALPLLFAALGLYLNGIQMEDNSLKSLILSKDTYKQATKLVLYNASGTSLDNLVSALEEQTVPLSFYNGSFAFLLDLSPHMAAFNVNTWDVTPDGASIDVTVIYNDTLQHSLPVAINMISNTYFQLVMEEQGLEQSDPITVRTHPLQITSEPVDFNIGLFSSSLLIGMVFVLVPVSLAIDMVYDREIRAKNQLRVNGLTFFMYFFTYFIVLGGLMIFICAALLGLIFVFDLPALRSPPAFVTLGTLVLLYCPPSILFSTVLSYIFDKTDTAQAILPNVATFLGLIPFILVSLIDMFRLGGRTAFALHTVFSIFNTAYAPYAVVYYVTRVYLACRVNSACSAPTFNDYLTDELIVLFVTILLHFPLWFCVLLIVDVKKSGGKASDAFSYLLGKQANREEVEVENLDVGEHEDADVQAERRKVAELMSSGAPDPPVVIVQNLRKEYTRSFNCRDGGDADMGKLAVRNLSLAVDAGEVFGLLGHNGAGKTTTMKIMIAEEAATRGRVQIGGHNITSNVNEAFQLMGYCPQHDAQWKNLTVREHLECYAAIRGVLPEDIPTVVDSFLTGLQIQDHANKQTQHCSGGTRRKLSFAMAMVGGPCVVLMDEPSTGMDPRSKRFLWDTILASFQGTRGSILTTHSMEEADALCSRVGIMVKGELRCVGSTQHLKNLYGAGYTLEIKLKAGDSTPTTPACPSRLLSPKQFVSNLFPTAVLEESFADRLVYSVPQQAVTSLALCFTKLERAKVELDIEEYCFSQTTLEQVFLKFAQYDEVHPTRED